MDTRKRGLPYAKANGGAKKFKSESEFSPSGIRSKSKPCMKYFSIDGCPYAENCHFLHYFPGGYTAVAQLMNLPPISTAPTAITATQTGPLKSKICKRFITADGCKFGNECHFAHGDWELGKPIATSHDHPHAPPRGTVSHRHMSPPRVAATFGASATAKISVDASLTGAIIGKGGENSKQIRRQTGAKIAIRDHESDANLKNIELEGTFDQIKEASAMVREIISSVGHGLPSGPPAVHRGATSHALMANKKTKMCEHFIKGLCTFGDRCRFAHGDFDLRKSGV